ncbi:MAG: putative ABC transporter permease [Lachnospiraceae bacterium]
MWEKIIFGYNAYHVILWFLTYSMLGWLIESIFMSICNKKLTNRGFAKGPFCPIYGVGALTVFFILRPYSDNVVILFFMGSILATFIELITAHIMKRMFGEIWWDYTEKPFNYKGVLCLESSIAWGIYTIALFGFLQNYIMMFVDYIPIEIGRIVGSILLIVFTLDFFISLYTEKKDCIPDNVYEFKEMILAKIGRF